MLSWIWQRQDSRLDWSRCHCSYSVSWPCKHPSSSAPDDNHVKRMCWYSFCSLIFFHHLIIWKFSLVIWFDTCLGLQDIFTTHLLLSLAPVMKVTLWRSDCCDHCNYNDDEDMMMIRQLAVPDISIYICLIDIQSKSKEQLNERRAGLSNIGPMHCNEWRPSNENFVQSTILWSF